MTIHDVFTFLFVIAPNCYMEKKNKKNTIVWFDDREIQAQYLHDSSALNAIVQIYIGILTRIFVCLKLLILLVCYSPFTQYIRKKNRLKYIAICYPNQKRSIDVSLYTIEKRYNLNSWLNFIAIGEKYKCSEGRGWRHVNAPSNTLFENTKPSNFNRKLMKKKLSTKSRMIIRSKRYLRLNVEFPSNLMQDSQKQKNRDALMLKV